MQATSGAEEAARTGSRRSADSSARRTPAAGHRQALRRSREGSSAADVTARAVQRVFVHTPPNIYASQPGALRMQRWRALFFHRSVDKYDKFWTMVGNVDEATVAAACRGFANVIWGANSLMCQVVRNQCRFTIDDATLGLPNLTIVVALWSHARRNDAETLSLGVQVLSGSQVVHRAEPSVPAVILRQLDGKGLEGYVAVENSFGNFCITLRVGDPVVKGASKKG